MRKKPASPPRLTSAEEGLALHRAERDATRAGLLTRVDRLRADLKPDAIAGRVIDDLTYKARGVAGQAMEIASDNRGIMVGTVAALAMWAARKPLGRGLKNLAHRASQWRGHIGPDTKEPEA
jgi:hypothetical protein